VNVATLVQTAIITAISMIVCSNQASQAAQKITKEQAVKIAEQFVVDNGYTAVRPKKVKRLAPELLDFDKGFEFQVQVRHDSLQPGAIAVWRGNREGKGWSVAFRHTETSKAEFRKTKYFDSTGKQMSPPPERDLGRIIVMDEFGKHCMIMHKDSFLDMLKPAELLPAKTDKAVDESPAK
jgi:hypothetical protein